MKGEVATSTIIWITLGLVVLIVMVIATPRILGNGLDFFGDKQCRSGVDSDKDGLMDSVDTCPCDGIGPEYVGKCTECNEYQNNCK